MGGGGGDVVRTISDPVSSAHRVYAEAEQHLEVFERRTNYRKDFEEPNDASISTIRKSSRNFL